MVLLNAIFTTALEAVKTRTGALASAYADDLTVTAEATDEDALRQRLQAADKEVAVAVPVVVAASLLLEWQPGVRRRGRLSS